MNNTEREKMKAKALQQFKSGKSLFAKGGAFAPLLQEFLQEALEAEMDAHLTEKERQKGNKRNGRGEKTIKSNVGTFKVNPPEDRHYRHQPKIIPKRSTVLAKSLAERIIGLYGLGMSFRDITKHIEEMYGTKVSHTTLAKIVERVTPLLKAWQSRKLEAVYVVLFLDAMYVKVHENGEVKTKALHNVLAINKDGKKEVLGSYLHETEGANFWLHVLTDLQNRGVKDVLIACTDNLKGFDKAISSIFPKAELQTCVVHQIRNSLKYIACKDKKAFMEELKKVYKASSKALAEEELMKLEEKWGKKYPLVIKSWLDNWDRLSTYFSYTPHIRKLIYTTNAIEGYHRQLRKVTKNKGAFPNDMALLRLVYLATQNIEKKWTLPIKDWGLTAQQLGIRFGDRMPLHLHINSTT